MRLGHRSHPRAWQLLAVSMCGKARADAFITLIVPSYDGNTTQKISLAWSKALAPSSAWSRTEMACSERKDHQNDLKFRPLVPGNAMAESLSGLFCSSLVRNMNHRHL